MLPTDFNGMACFRKTFQNKFMSYMDSWTSLIDMHFKESYILFIEAILHWGTETVICTLHFNILRLNPKHLWFMGSLAHNDVYASFTAATDVIQQKLLLYFDFISTNSLSKDDFSRQMSPQTN